MFILPFNKREILGNLCTGLINNSVKLCLPHSGFDKHTYNTNKML